MLHCLTENYYHILLFQYGASIWYSGSGLYCLNYSLPVSGLYQLSIQLNGVDIQDSPTPVSINPAVAAPDHSSMIVASGSSWTWNHFTVTVYDRFDNIQVDGSQQFIVNLDNHNDTIIRGIVANQGNGVFDVSYYTELSGDYTLSVALATGNDITSYGLQGSYHNNRWLQGSPVLVRVDPFIWFDWNSDLITPTAAQYVSVRWTGYILVDYADTYTFTAEVDVTTKHIISIAVAAAELFELYVSFVVLCSGRCSPLC